MNYWTFEELRIGRLFHMNGCDYMKQSTRTARMLDNGRTFYIGKTDRVHTIPWLTITAIHTTKRRSTPRRL